MATYKVIQDIEAEDKLLGPLTLRQFIYAIIVIALGGLAFLASKANILLAVPFLFPMGFFGLLAAPFGRDQSSEIWLLAKIRFMFKPRRRIWDQSGIKELVTITVPKKIEKHLTDGLDQTQVRSRLTALASTLDSRGWAIKNVTVNTFTVPAFAMSGPSDSDRLVSASAFPQPVAADDIVASDDILDEHNNPTALKLDSMIAQSEQARRQSLIATMQTGQVAAPATTQTQAPDPAASQWYAQPTQPPVIPAAPTTTQLANPSAPAAVTGGVQSAEEQALLEKLHKDHEAGINTQNGHMKRLQTTEEIAQAEANAKAAKEAEAARDTELKRLASNDDLNIATIARQAKKDSDEPQIMNDGEVVISLH